MSQQAIAAEAAESRPASGTEPAGTVSMITEPAKLVSQDVSEENTNSEQALQPQVEQRMEFASTETEGETELDGASYARSLLMQPDKDKKNIFNIQNKYRFKKLLALLGDHYRTAVNFPMDKNTAAALELFRAYYADPAITSTKPTLVYGPIWARMDVRIIRTLRLSPERSIRHLKRNFRSIGGYALPGQTVTVTRSDDSVVDVAVRISSLRNGSTRIYADDGYKQTTPVAKPAPIHRARRNNSVHI